jgi:hypothetical protein
MKTLATRPKSAYSPEHRFILVKLNRHQIDIVRAIIAYLTCKKISPRDAWAFSKSD